jgi:cell division protein FtsQ
MIKSKLKATTTIRKIIFITVWLCIGGGMLTLLLAAISKKKRGVCKDYTIAIKGVQKNFFIDEKDVEQLIMKAAKSGIKNEPVSNFRLYELEQLLENNTWIEKAELYFDNRDVLHITVSEKEPVARIFTTAGSSFYIDSLGRQMPLSDKMSAKVPVFTGFPLKKKLSVADSVLLEGVRQTALYISNHPFWMSQVAQVDITANQQFEMVPVVGNHLVKLGDGYNMPQKFNRLMVFYKQVLSKTGFDKYRVIDVQYKGQVVASRYAGDAKLDSVQLRKNVEKLLKQTMESTADSATRILQPGVKPERDSAIAPDPSLADNTELIPEQRNPVPLNTTSSVKTDKNKNPKPAGDKPQPKAVMPKRPGGQ